MSSKHINMGSSFEDLVVTSLTVKTVCKSDKRFDLQNILNFLIFIINMMRSARSLQNVMQLKVIVCSQITCCIVEGGQIKHHSFALFKKKINHHGFNKFK
jgi:hypothetical protein